MSVCSTCLPIDACSQGLDRYSLQDANYFFVITCPPGYDCGTVDEVTVIGCEGTVFSAIIPSGTSAADRQLIINGLVDQALQLAPFCNGGEDGDCVINCKTNPTDPDPPVILYASRTQCCNAKCPDGSNFNYCLRAGAFIGFTQAEVDRKAHTRACELAKDHKICLSSLNTTQCCSGSAFTQTIKATGNYLNAGGLFNFWSVSSGLPPGLTATVEGYTANKSITISGTSTTPGMYQFTVNVTAPNGDHMFRYYSICVIGQTVDPVGPDDTHIPNVIPGTPYTCTLKAPPCSTEPLSWKLTSGTLPDGLTLNETTGEISGTVPADASPDDFIFTVTLHAGTSFSCAKEWTVTVGTVPIAAYWTLDEADPSVDRVDSVTGIVLTPLGPTDSGAPALVGNGLHFTALFGGAGYSTLGTEPVLDYTANDSVSFWGWFKTNTEGDGNAFGGPNFGLSIDTDGITIAVGDILGPNPCHIFTNGDSVYTAVTDGDWHFFHLAYNGTIHKWGWSIDDGALVYLPTVVPLNSATAILSTNPAWTGAAGDVLYDEVGIIIGDMLTPVQQTYLYNSGFGRTWPIVLP